MILDYTYLTIIGNHAWIVSIVSYINIIRMHMQTHSREKHFLCHKCDKLVFYFSIFIILKFHIWNIFRQILLYFYLILINATCIICIYIPILSGESLVKSLISSKTKRLSLCDLCVICELDIIVLVYICLSCNNEPKTISLRC